MHGTSEGKPKIRLRLALLAVLEVQLDFVHVLQGEFAIQVDPELTHHRVAIQHGHDHEWNVISSSCIRSTSYVTSDVCQFTT